MKSKKEAKTKASYIDGFVLPVQKKNSLLTEIWPVKLVKSGLSMEH